MIRTRRPLALTVAGMVTVAASFASAPRAASLSSPAPRTGTWDKKGRYRSPPEIQNFRHLHRAAASDIPRYPIVLVHGLFGFDTLKLGPFVIKYFVGVAEHLRAQGLEVFVPETTPFAGFEQRATELKAQVEAEMQARGWEKVHLIAHSAGGLDSRYMISRLGMADRVASLTTVSSPHRGVWYADFALRWVFEKQKMWKIWDLFGLHREGIHEISVAGMREFNAQTPDAPGVRYFSFGGAQPYLKIIPPLSTGYLVNKIAERAAAGHGPTFSQRLVLARLLPKKVRKALRRDPRRFVEALTGGPPTWIEPGKAGKNDGLVSLSAARWGEYQTDLAYDHLDEMGWFTFFNVKRFYRNITRMLADAGL